MYLELTPEQQMLQSQLRSYFADLVAEVEHSALEEPTYTRYILRMGEDGWLGPGVAGRVRRSGSRPSGPEDLRRGVPLGGRTAASAHVEQCRSDPHGPRHRRAEASHPPGILRGEIHFSIGYYRTLGAVPTWRHSRLVPSATVTNTSSTARRSSPARSSTPTTSGLPPGPTRIRRSTRVCPSSWCRSTPQDSTGRRWPPSSATSPARPSTRTSGSRSRISSAPRTEGWKLITNQLNHERVAICPG